MRWCEIITVHQTVEVMKLAIVSLYFPNESYLHLLFINITLKRKAVTDFDDTDCFRSDSSKDK